MNPEKPGFESHHTTCLVPSILLDHLTHTYTHTQTRTFNDHNGACVEVVDGLVVADMEENEGDDPSHTHTLTHADDHAPSHTFTDPIPSIQLSPSSFSFNAITIHINIPILISTIHPYTNSYTHTSMDATHTHTSMGMVLDMVSEYGGDVISMVCDEDRYVHTHTQGDGTHTHTHTHITCIFVDDKMREIMQGRMEHNMDDVYVYDTQVSVFMYVYVWYQFRNTHTHTQL